MKRFFVQHLPIFCLTGLLLCQAVLARTGGLQLCLPTSDTLVQLSLNCNEPDVQLCCSKNPQNSLVQADLGQSCALCFELNLGSDLDDPWHAGERVSPKLPVFICAPGLPQAAAPHTLFVANVYPQRAPPQVNDALRQFRDVVALRI